VKENALFYKAFLKKLTKKRFGTGRKKQGQIPKTTKKQKKYQKAF